MLWKTFEYQQAKATHNFRKVSNPDNWKYPTHAKMVNTLLEAHHIQEAVVHFTGCLPDVEKISNKFVVYPTVGYYVEIGA